LRVGYEHLSICLVEAWWVDGKKKCPPDEKSGGHGE
jgi:hypothetical protein